MKLLLLLALAFVQIATAQTGDLLPLPSERPDEKVLATASVKTSIRVDNQSMTVRVTQVFENRTAVALEAKYVYALPADAAVTDFAVWDDSVRLPGVMMEKRRAAGIYAAIRNRATDPGLLQADEDAAGRTVFTARVFPIPAFGTKRIEIEYQQELGIASLASRLVLPLRSASNSTAGKFDLDVDIVSETPLAGVEFDDSTFPMIVDKCDAHRFAAHFTARDFALDRDFTLSYELDSPSAVLSLIGFRAPESVSAYELRNPSLAAKSADGYFQLRAVDAGIGEVKKTPRRVVVALDTSLSMAGEKLSRAFETTELLLRALGSDDEFDLVLFSDDIRAFRDAPVAASPENIGAALDFIRASSLGGGTNLKAAIAGVALRASKFSNGKVSAVLITDANATRETIDRKIIADAARNSDFNFITLAVGLDADQSLAGEVASRTGGGSFAIRETDDAAPVAALITAKLAGEKSDVASLTTSDPANLYDVYPVQTHDSTGESFSFVGRYRTSGRAAFSVITPGGGSLAGEFELPEFASDHRQLPRLWAKSRIDALLRSIDLDGETEDAIDEIIALSQKYKIASPYTAFIAAPRALLRPRLIQPGDPVIRVRTDPSVTAVFAVLPFGETVPLKFLKDENVWETRFLAPSWMSDGQYSCRLLLTDKNGDGFEESKTFIVDSRAPEPKIVIDERRYFAGADVLVRVLSDRDTAGLTAAFPGAAPTRLRWSDEEKANVGVVSIPARTVSGRYRLSVTAEDFAHNQSSVTAIIEVEGQ